MGGFSFAIGNWTFFTVDFFELRVSCVLEATIFFGGRKNKNKKRRRKQKRKTKEKEKNKNIRQKKEKK